MCNTLWFAAFYFFKIANSLHHFCNRLQTATNNTEAKLLQRSAAIGYRIWKQEFCLRIAVRPTIAIKEAVACFAYASIFQYFANPVPRLWNHNDCTHSSGLIKLCSSLRVLRYISSGSKTKCCRRLIVFKQVRVGDPSR